MPDSMTRLLGIVLVIAAANVVHAAASEPQSAGSKQYATIRPTHRLTKEDTRTSRKVKQVPGVPQRKSGNISPLRRELPQAVVLPPKTRRRAISW
jgi:hypothetical protein